MFLALTFLSLALADPGTPILEEGDLEFLVAEEESLPEWVTDDFGEFSFRHPNGCMSRSLREAIGFNERGLIRAEELLRLEAIILDTYNTEILGEILAGGEPKPDPRAEPQYRADLALAMLALNRIVDHEVISRKIVPRVSETRLDYVVRSILVENAVERGSVPVCKIEKRNADGSLARDLEGKPVYDTQANLGASEPETIVNSWLGCGDSDVIAKHSSEALHAWLADSAREAQARYDQETADLKAKKIKRRTALDHLALEIDWRYRKNGLALSQEITRDETGPEWPVVRFKLPLKGFPEDYFAFRETLQRKLDWSARVLYRQEVWKEILRKTQAATLAFAGLSVTKKELDDTYSAYRDSALTASDRETRLAEIVIRPGWPSLDRSWESAHSFRDAYTKKIVAKKDEMLAAYRAKHPGETALALLPDFADFVRECREMAVGAALEETKTEYRLELLARAVVVERTESTHARSALDGEPEGDSIQAQRSRFALPSRAKPDLIPIYQVVDPADGAIRVWVRVEEKEGEPHALPRDDRRTERVLRDLIIGKRQAFAMREAALDLFRKNRFTGTHWDTCQTSDFPCVSSDPVRWVEVLFPETPFQGESIYEDYGAGPKPLGSSLGRYELLGQVRSISLDRLEMVFNLPN